MKHSILVLGFAALVVCCSPQEKGTSISVLEDITDSTLVHYDQNEVVALFVDEQKDWYEKRYRHQYITDSDYNPVVEEFLPDEYSMFGNSEVRTDALETFLRNVGRYHQRDTTQQFHYSSIWVPLWNEIAKMSTYTSTKVHIYCFTDALEHTHWMNMYDPSVREKLVREPETMRQTFFARLPEIFDGSHISLYIVHQPTHDENELFNLIIEEVYRPACDRYGIHFEVIAKI